MNQLNPWYRTSGFHSFPSHKIPILFRCSHELAVNLWSLSKSQVESELLKLQFQGRSHALMTDKWLNLDSNRHAQWRFQIKKVKFGFWRRQESWDAKVDLESRYHILISDFIAVKSSRVRSPTRLAAKMEHFHTFLIKNGILNSRI